MRYDDLTGKRFGKLTVLEQCGTTKNRQRCWKCLCDCGSICTVTTCNLTHEKTKSCGCNHRRDLTGQRFGKLTVLERSDIYAPRGKRKTRQWKCVCDCGEIVYKATDVLTNPSVSMCQNCAAQYSTAKAREKAGFVSGTQLSKISNMSPSAANTSGIRGVYYERRLDRWRAEIRFQGKRYYLGTFKKKEDAVQARKKAENELFLPFLDNYNTVKAE